MLRSNDGIRVSHAGSLPRPTSISELAARSSEVGDLETAFQLAVTEMVAEQIASGIHTINDGEISKRSGVRSANNGGFAGYIRERMSGFQPGRLEGKELDRAPVNGRDRRDFPDFYREGPGSSFEGASTRERPPSFAVEPLRYVGYDEVDADIDRLKKAADGNDVELFLTAVAPGNVEHWLWNRYYPDEESFVFAIADVLHEEYKRIADAGIVLQIDDPDLADAWQMFPDLSVKEYLSYAQLRIEALNQALQGVPEELVRFHMCWGSQHGPHYDDIPLADLLPLIYRIKAQCYSIEASNSRHEHEWEVFKQQPLPDGKILMPGVVGHASDIVEHERTVAQRLIRYADVVGVDNVVAGTDCGLGSRVGSPGVAWAKLRALSAGALLATEQLRG